MELGVHEIEFVVSFDLFLFFKSYLYNLRQSKNAAKHSDYNREALSGWGGRRGTLGERQVK